MDCRKSVLWPLALLGGMAGCTTTGTSTSPATPPPANPPQAAPIDPSLVKKESDLPKKQPTAKMCVVWANGAASEAAQQFDSPVQANELRNQARQAYRQALKIDPKCLDAYTGLAYLYLAMEDHEHAVATRDGLKYHPQNAGLWFDLGTIYSTRKEWGPALEYLAKAAELEPENRLYVNTLGHAQARSGRPQDALRTYLRVNTEAKSYITVARMMQHINQPELSRQYLQAALQKDPQVQGAPELIALLEGRAQQAIQQASYNPAQIGDVMPVPQN